MLKESGSKERMILS